MTKDEQITDLKNQIKKLEEKSSSNFESIFLQHLNEKAKIQATERLKKIKYFCLTFCFVLSLLFVSWFLWNFDVQYETEEEETVTEVIKADNQGTAIKNTGNENNFIIGNDNEVK